MRGRIKNDGTVIRMNVTDRCAYEAMCLFIERYWKRTGKTDELGDLLSDIWPSTVQGGAPGDPASWTDFIECLQEACSHPIEPSRPVRGK